MEIERCFETLELPPNASVEDIRQAHRDLVNIWHPDRVPDNSRLKKKAEEKLKEINLAYEELTSVLSSQPKTHFSVQQTPPQQNVYHPPRSPTQGQTGTRAQQPYADLKPKSNFFSTLWTFLSKALDVLSRMPGPSHKTMQNRTERVEPFESQRRNRCIGRRGGKGGGMGRGKRCKGRRR